MSHFSIYGSQLIGRLLSANMNSTADQAIAIISTKYVLRKVIVTNASVSLTLAAGGLYTAASKGGTALIASTQLYSALTATTKWIDLTINTGPITDVVTATTLYFSLTTAQGSAATADIYIIGDKLT